MAPPCVRLPIASGTCSHSTDVQHVLWFYRASCHQLCCSMHTTGNLLWSVWHVQIVQLIHCRLMHFFFSIRRACERSTTACCTCSIHGFQYSFHVSIFSTDAADCESNKNLRHNYWRRHFSLVSAKKYLGRRAPIGHQCVPGERLKKLDENLWKYERFAAKSSNQKPEKIATIDSPACCRGRMNSKYASTLCRRVYIVRKQ